jgi:hypothetical protein
MWLLSPLLFFTGDVNGTSSPLCLLPLWASSSSLACHIPLGLAMPLLSMPLLSMPPHLALAFQLWRKSFNL